MSKMFVIGTASALIALTATGTGAAVAGSGEHDRTVTGLKAGQAIAAALNATGGGRANSVERDRENGATWEVEVTKTDGTTVDVRLDRTYQVVVIEADREVVRDREDSGDHRPKGRQQSRGDREDRGDHRPRGSQQRRGDRDDRAVSGRNAKDADAADTVGTGGGRANSVQRDRGNRAHQAGRGHENRRSHDGRRH